eukprot:m51a1_g5391 hypothetical protein (366) ;mRNA; r:35926-37338
MSDEGSPGPGSTSPTSVPSRALPARGTGLAGANRHNAFALASSARSLLSSSSPASIGATPRLSLDSVPRKSFQEEATAAGYNVTLEIAMPDGLPTREMVVDVGETVDSVKYKMSSQGWLGGGESHTSFRLCVNGHVLLDPLSFSDFNEFTPNARVKVQLEATAGEPAGPAIKAERRELGVIDREELELELAERAAEVSQLSRCEIIPPLRDVELVAPGVPEDPVEKKMQRPLSRAATQSVPGTRKQVMKIVDPGQKDGNGAKRASMDGGSALPQPLMLKRKPSGPPSAHEYGAEAPPVVPRQFCGTEMGDEPIFSKEPPAKQTKATTQRPSTTSRVMDPTRQMSEIISREGEVEVQSSGCRCLVQ